VGNVNIRSGIRSAGVYLTTEHTEQTNHSAFRPSQRPTSRHSWSAKIQAFNPTHLHQAAAKNASIKRAMSKATQTLKPLEQKMAVALEALIGHSNWSTIDAHGYQIRNLRDQKTGKWGTEIRNPQTGDHSFALPFSARDQKGVQKRTIVDLNTGAAWQESLDHHKDQRWWT
jgi:hypothetical protein